VAGDVPAGLCRPLLDEIDTHLAIHSHNTDAHALVVYTDRLLIKDESGLERGVGAGAWVTRLGKVVQELSWPCRRKAEVYDAKMIGLAKGMVAAGRLGQLLPGHITRVLCCGSTRGTQPNKGKPTYCCTERLWRC
jgi:hypothetical protein